MKNLKARIDELMAAKGWTVTQVANAAGVSRSAVSQWRGSGSKEIFTIGRIDVAERLGAASGFSALWLARGEGPKLASDASEDSTRAFWPLPSIPAEKWRELPEDVRNKLDGALALAIAQLNIGLDVARPSKPASIVAQARDIKEQQAASNDEEYAYIDRLDVKLAAGHGKIVHHAEPRARLSFRRDWLRSQGITCEERAVLVDVEGDSMTPTLPDGSTILVDLNRTEILSGHVYALAQNGEFCVKRLYLEEGGVFAHSDNTAHKPFQLTEGAHIIGRVFWVGATVGEQ